MPVRVCVCANICYPNAHAQQERPRVVPVPVPVPAPPAPAPEADQWVALTKAKRELTVENGGSMGYNYNSLIIMVQLVY